MCPTCGTMIMMAIVLLDRIRSDDCEPTVAAEW